MALYFPRAAWPAGHLIACFIGLKPKWAIFYYLVIALKGNAMEQVKSWEAIIFTGLQNSRKNRKLFREQDAGFRHGSPKLLGGQIAGQVFWEIRQNLSGRFYLRCYCAAFSAKKGRVDHFLKVVNPAA
jgi:hypothetical protein